MPQGIRFRILNENLAKVELKISYFKGVTIMLIAIGIFLLIVSIWSYVTFGGGLELNILTGSMWIIAFFIYRFEQTITIDKRKKLVISSRNLAIITQIRDEWDIDRVLEFKAVTKDFLIDRVSTASVRDETANLITDAMTGKPHKTGDIMRKHGLTTIGIFQIKLKTGEIIDALRHKYPEAPKNCAEHANLFLKGKSMEPGIFYT